jgi:hypothetical protein
LQNGIAYTHIGNARREGQARLPRGKEPPTYR